MTYRNKPLRIFLLLVVLMQFFGCEKTILPELTSFSVGDQVVEIGSNDVEIRVNLPSDFTSVDLEFIANDSSVQIVSDYTTITESVFGSSVIFTFKVLVISSDALESREYTVFLERSLSSNATLSSITIGGVSLGIFAADKLNYDIVLPFGTIAMPEVEYTLNNEETYCLVEKDIAFPGCCYLETLAADGITTLTYILSFSVDSGSSNTALTFLNIDGSSIPGFEPQKNSYSYSVNNTITSLLLSLAVSDPLTKSVSISITGVAGEHDYSFATSPNYLVENLSVGTNSLQIKITSENDTESTIEININRGASSDDRLGTVSFTPVIGGFVFDSVQTTYNLTVGNLCDSISFSASPSDSLATMTWNFQDNGWVALPASTLQSNLDLDVGVNVLKLKVVAENADEEIYTFNCSRDASVNADLSSLLVNPAISGYVFNSDILIYNLFVQNSYSDLSFRPTAASTEIQSLQVKQEDLSFVVIPSGVDTASFPLVVGDNQLSFKVTAESGAVQTYIVNIDRALSSDVKLSSISLIPEPSDFSFSSLLTLYDYTYENSVTSISFNSAGSSETLQTLEWKFLEGPWTSIDHNQNSPDLPLGVGINLLQVKVTAQNSTDAIYQFNLTRLPSDNSFLNSVSFLDGVEGFVFENDQLDLDLTVSSDIRSISFNAVAEEPTLQTIRWNLNSTGWLYYSSGIDQSISLATAGEHDLQIEVTAENGDISTYNLTLTRNSHDDSFASDLGILPTVDGYTFNPLQSAYILEYIYDIDEMQFSVVSGDTGYQQLRYNVDGGDWNSLNFETLCTISALQVGDQLLNIEVTAEDLSKTLYKLTLRRLPSTEATLNSCAITPDPALYSFDSEVISYTTLFNSLEREISFTPVGSQVILQSYSWRYEGSSWTGITSGSLITISDLAAGSSLFEIKVLAQDGVTSRIYQFTITRPADTNSVLSNMVLNPVLSGFTFDSSITSYSITSAHSVDSFSFTPTASNSELQLIRKSYRGGSWSTVSSGNASAFYSLNVGANELVVRVYAEDNSFSDYTFLITREPSSNCKLSSLVMDPYPSSFLFTSTINTYNKNIAYEEDDISFKLTPEDPTVIGLSISKNGAASVSYSSGVAGTSVALDVGLNEFEIVVTAADSSTLSYFVNITRAPSNESRLADLVFSAGISGDTFDKDISSYAASSSSSDRNFNFSAELLNDSLQSLSYQYKGTGWNSISTLQLISDLLLDAGDNLLEVKVIAADNTFLIYDFTINRPADNNNVLENMQFSPLPSGYSYDSATTTYSITVPKEQTQFSFTATIGDPDYQTIESSFRALAWVENISGVASSLYTLPIGISNLRIGVTAEDGSFATSNFNITRLESDNADLGDLELIPSITGFTFNPSIQIQDLTFDSSVNSFQIRLTKDEPSQQKLEYSWNNGSYYSITEGSTSSSLSTVTAVSKILKIRITAEDDSLKVYQYNVSRELSDNCNVTNISISSLTSDGYLFDPAVTAYNHSVSNSTSGFSFSMTGEDPNRQTLFWRVNSVEDIWETGSMLGSRYVDLNTGNNSLDIKVVSETGTFSLYEYQVFRGYSTDAYLSTVALTPGPSGFSFKYYDTTYPGLTVDASQATVHLTAQSRHIGSTIYIKYNGEPAEYELYTERDLTLLSGNNILYLKVVAEDGTTENSYSFGISKPDVSQSYSIINDSINPLNNALNMTYGNDYMYVLNSASEIEIFDVSDRSQFSSCGTFTVSDIQQLEVVGNNLVLWSAAGIHLWSLANPLAPVYQESHAGVCTPYSIAGTHLYVEQSEGVLQLFEVTSSAFSLLSEINHGTDVVRIESDGTRLYLQQAGLDDIAVYDISTIGTPVLEGTWNSPKTVNVFSVDSNYLYLVTGNYLYVYDVTLLSNITHTIYKSMYDITNIIADNGRCVVMMTYGKIELLDLANRSSLFTYKSLDVGSGTFQKFYLADPGFSFYFTDNPIWGSIAHPAAFDESLLENSYIFHEQTLCMGQEGSLVAVCEDSQYIFLYDMTDPLNPTELSFFKADNRALSIVIDGDEVYVSTYASLKVYDISDPTTPTLLSTLADADYCFQMIVDNNIIYGMQPRAIVTVDITNTSSMILLDSISLSSDSMDTQTGIALNGSYLYSTMDWANQLTILNIFDPATLSIEGFQTRANHLSGCFIKYGNLFVTEDSTGLLLYDLSDPTSPSFVGVTTSVPNDNVCNIGEYVIGFQNSSSTATISILQTPTQVSYLSPVTGIQYVQNVAQLPTGEYLFATKNDGLIVWGP